MARQVLNGGPNPIRLDLQFDAMLTEVYGVADYFKTPGYTGSSPKIAIGTASVGIGSGVSSAPINHTLALDGNNNALGLQRSGNGAIASACSLGTGMRLQTNWYYSSLDKAATAGYSPAIDLLLSDGTVRFYRSTTVAADASISLTESGRLDAGGNLLINRTTQASGGKVEITGNLVLQPSASAPTLGVNGDMSFQLVSNTSLKILVRGSDGTTRSATLTLS